MQAKPKKFYQSHIRALSKTNVQSPWLSFAMLNQFVILISRIGFVFPWLVSYFLDVPNLSSSTFGGLAVSSKTMTYILALQVRMSSQAQTNHFRALMGFGWGDPKWAGVHL